MVANEGIPSYNPTEGCGDICYRWIPRGVRIDVLTFERLQPPTKVLFNTSSALPVIRRVIPPLIGVITPATNL